LKINKVKIFKKKFKYKKGRQNYLTEPDLYNRNISKLKLENLFRNAEKIDFIFDVTYVIKLLNFKLNESRFKHFKKTFEK